MLNVMSTIQLRDEIKQLPRTEQILLAEWILKQSAKPHQISLSAAAARMLHDYETDTELTVFTALDSEDFHETR